MFPLLTMQTQIKRSKHLLVVVRMQHTNEIKKIYITDDLARNLPRFSERNVNVSNRA